MNGLPQRRLDLDACAQEKAPELAGAFLHGLVRSNISGCGDLAAAR
jgi:hypothetical protein